MSVDPFQKAADESYMSHLKDQIIDLERNKRKLRFSLLILLSAQIIIILVVMGAAIGLAVRTYHFFSGDVNACQTQNNPKT